MRRQRLGALSLLVLGVGLPVERRIRLRPLDLDHPVERGDRAIPARRNRARSVPGRSRSSRGRGRAARDPSLAARPLFRAGRASTRGRDRSSDPSPPSPPPRGRETSIERATSTALAISGVKTVCASCAARTAWTARSAFRAAWSGDWAASGAAIASAPAIISVSVSFCVFMTLSLEVRIRVSVAVGWSAPGSRPSAARAPGTTPPAP